MRFGAGSNNDAESDRTKPSPAAVEAAWMSDVGDSYASLAAARGMQPVDGFWPGPVTPTLVKGGALGPALRGSLLDGVEGVIARHRYGTDGGGFDFNVVFARLPESQPFCHDCSASARAAGPTTPTTASRSATRGCGPRANRSTSASRSR
jgi:hypothetical protein